ncbi:MAG: DUF2797 domain-containing protein [Thermoplasmata archaeon]
MFRDAQSLLDDKRTFFKVKEVHVVSFRWNEFKPELKIFQDNKLSELDVGYIDFNVSQGKWCVGNFEVVYTPCPNERQVSVFRQCKQCASPAIARQECIFEPGDCDDCPGGFCQEEHVVYLAFHGIHPKVGMTLKNRLKQRIIEQGADAYCILGTYPDRVIARKNEISLSEELDIPQRVGSKKVLKYMARKLDKHIVGRKYRAVKNQVTVGKLHFVNDYPIPRPLRGEPRLRATAGMHRGKQVGLKGRYLIYESGGLQALDLSDLQGRKVRINESYYIEV